MSNNESARKFLQNLETGFLLVDGKEVDGKDVVYEIVREDGELMLKRRDCEGNLVGEPERIPLEEAVNLAKNEGFHDT